MSVTYSVVELHWSKVLILSMERFCFSSPQFVPSMFASGLHMIWVSGKILTPRKWWLVIYWEGHWNAGQELRGNKQDTLGGWDHPGLGAIAVLLCICLFKILQNLLGSLGESKASFDLGDTWWEACPPTTMSPPLSLMQARVLRTARHHFFPLYFILEGWDSI